MALTGKGRLGLSRRHIVAALVTIPIALASARSAAIGIFADRLPGQALAIDAGNAIALMKQVDSDLGVGGLNQTPKDNWRADAVTALRERPLTPSAIRILGFVAAADGRQSEARRLATLAERVSRRDGLAQLWLVRDAAKRDDARAALAHMDIALSVHVPLQPIIFPMLLNVIQDPAYAKEFRQIVVRDRSWLASFMSFANTDNPDPEPLADVVSSAGGLPPGDNFRMYETDLLWSLANAKKLDRAAKLLVQLGRATTATLADGRVSNSTLDTKLGPFAWSASTDADVSSAFEPGGILRVTTAPGKSGVILRRYFALPPGAYILSSKARSDIEDVDAKMGLDIDCMSGPAMSIRSIETTISPAGNAVNASFAVPPNCPLQLVQFTGRSADSQMDGALTLSEISLRKTKPNDPAAAAPGK